MRIFHTSVYWNLIDNKFSHVSRTVFSIQAEPSNIVAWIVSILFPISNSSSSLSKPLGTVPSIENAIVITVSFIFHSFLSSS